MTGPTMSRAVNRRVKRWPGWAALVLVLVGLVAFGTTRDTGPRTPDERIESISKRLACPVCQGESVYESRNTASVQIREAIKQSVSEGVQSDDEIIQSIVNAYDGEELLVPTASGVEALAWALPATAFVIGVVGLGVAFRRWRESAAGLGEATDADYALVAQALADSHAGAEGIGDVEDASDLADPADPAGGEDDGGR